MISVKNVTVRSGGFSLQRIALEIPAGGYGVLMGRTGSGKTSEKRKTMPACWSTISWTVWRAPPAPATPSVRKP